MDPALWGAGSKPSSYRKEELLLLKFNLSTSLFEFSLEGLSVSLGDFLLDSGGSLVDDLLSLFETETGVLLDGLDDLELSGASALEDDVELSLLCGGSSSTCSGSGYSDSCSGGLNAVLLFEDVSEFVDFLYSKIDELFSERLDICHCI